MVRRIGGELDGTKRNVMHMQVIRVPVQTFWTEREDHVRADRPNMRYEIRRGGLDRYANERLRMLC